MLKLRTQITFKFTSERFNTKYNQTMTNIVKTCHR